MFVARLKLSLSLSLHMRAKANNTHTQYYKSLKFRVRLSATRSYSSGIEMSAVHMGLYGQQQLNYCSHTQRKKQQQ